ncbi:hypothetical protein [Streptodolium elevatio]
METEPDGIIAVRRVGGGKRDFFRAYQVLVDGAVVGRAKRGQTHTFTVRPGTHRVQLTIDWCSSPELVIEVAGGQVARFVCAPGGGRDRGAVGPDRAGEYIAFGPDTDEA